MLRVTECVRVFDVHLGVVCAGMFMKTFVTSCVLVADVSAGMVKFDKSVLRCQLPGGEDRDVHLLAAKLDVGDGRPDLAKDACIRFFGQL